jgi:phosphoglycerol geranylgeranyltransferase
MNIYNYLINIITSKGAAFLVLLDPDKIKGEKLKRFVAYCEKSGVDGFLIGGSLLLEGNLYESITTLKSASKLPVIIFPGEVDQITPNADAVLFISLISGRNADQIIGKHVLAAPIIRKHKIEPISTGYMLIESGSLTTAEYVSGSKPIPRKKPEIAAATALAGEYLGMKLIYLEAGSGADQPVPDEMVKLVSQQCSIPVIVGGGIRDSETAGQKVKNGAGIIVIGNFFENENNWDKIPEFASAIHKKLQIEV